MRSFSKPDAMPRSAFDNHAQFAVIRPYRTLSLASVGERRHTTLKPPSLTPEAEPPLRIAKPRE